MTPSLTIEELLQGKQIDCPKTDTNVTFKKARRFLRLSPGVRQTVKTLSAVRWNCIV